VSRVRTAAEKDKQRLKRQEQVRNRPLTPDPEIDPKCILKVSSTTDPNKLAGAIASEIRVEGIVVIDAIGGGSVNQAIKAIAVARGWLVPSGILLIFYPKLIDRTLEDEAREVTVTRLFCQPREPLTMV